MPGIGSDRGIIKFSKKNANISVDTGDLGSINANESATATVNAKIESLSNSQVDGITDYGYKTTESKSTGEFSTKGGTKVFERRLIPNAMHGFATVNQIFTLAALDLEEINFPHVLQKRPPKYPVAQSAGKGTEEITVFKNAGLNLEFFIDNVDIQAAVAPQKKTGLSQATKITFDVIEPYSLGIFFQALKIQAGKANGDPEYNHLQACYALIIDFIGTDDKGNTASISGGRRVIPIGIKQANIEANQGGAVYRVEAYPWNEIAQLDINNKTFDDVTLTGSTVHEMLQTGEKSLMAQLNTRKLNDEKTAKKTNSYAIPVDDAIVFFPNILGLDDYFLNTKTLEAAKQDRAVKGQQDYDTGEATYKSAFENEKQDTLVESLLLKGANAVNVTNQYTLTGGKGIRATQATATPQGDFDTGWAGNEIGASKMYISENDIDQIGKTFPEFDKTWDKDKKIFARNKFTLDLKKQTLTFKKGTSITHIIETVVLLSEYGTRIGKRATQIKGKSPGEVPWFKIHTQMFQLKDSYIQSITKKHPSIRVFHVIPYQVQEHLFIDPSEYAPDTNFLLSQIAKKYDYIYTGDNQDILDFQIQYQFGFFKALSTNINDTSQRGIDESNSDKSFKQNDKTNYGYSSSTIKSSFTEGLPTLRADDMVNPRAEGTDGESTELKIARMYNDMIINSEVDLVNLTVNIVGDTYYLPNSGMGNYTAPLQVVDSRNTVDNEGNRHRVASVFVNGDGEANFMNRMVLCELNFLTPVDLREQTGDMVFAGYKNEAGEPKRLGTFSGMFRITHVNSSFRQGKFTQELKMVRGAHLGVDAPSGTKSDKTSIKSQVDLNELIKMERDYGGGGA